MSTPRWARRNARHPPFPDMNNIVSRALGQPKGTKLFCMRFYPLRIQVLNGGCKNHVTCVRFVLFVVPLSSPLALFRCSELETGTFTYLPSHCRRRLTMPSSTFRHRLRSTQHILINQCTIYWCSTLLWKDGEAHTGSILYWIIDGQTWQKLTMNYM